MAYHRNTIFLETLVLKCQWKMTTQSCCIQNGRHAMPTVAESKTLKNSHGGVSSFVLTCIWHLPDRKTAVKVRTMVQNRWAENGFVRGSVKEEVTGGYGGRTLINRLEAMMDKRRKTLEDIVIQRGTEAPK